jgi:hypothetical protein
MAAEYRLTSLMKGFGEILSSNCFDPVAIQAIAAGTVSSRGLKISPHPG